MPHLANQSWRCNYATYFPLPNRQCSSCKGVKKKQQQQQADRQTACCHSRPPSRRRTVESNVALILLWAARDTSCWNVNLYPRSTGPSLVENVCIPFRRELLALRKNICVVDEPEMLIARRLVKCHRRLSDSLNTREPVQPGHGAVAVTRGTSDKWRHLWNDSGDGTIQRRLKGTLSASYRSEAIVIFFSFPTFHIEMTIRSC